MIEKTSLTNCSSLSTESSSTMVGGGGDGECPRLDIALTFSVGSVDLSSSLKC